MYGGGAVIFCGSVRLPLPPHHSRTLAIHLLIRLSPFGSVSVAQYLFPMILAAVSPSRCIQMLTQGSGADRRLLVDHPPLLRLPTDADVSWMKAYLRTRSSKPALSPFPLLSLLGGRAFVCYLLNGSGGAPFHFPSRRDHIVCVYSPLRVWRDQAWLPLECSWMNADS